MRSSGRQKKPLLCSQVIRSSETSRCSDSRSGVRLTLEGDRLPALPGALEAAALDLRTGGERRNREYVGDAIELDAIAGTLVSLGFDAQTSGGLLAAVPGDRAAVLEAAFRGEGLFVARVGRVEEGSGVRVV